MKNKGFTLIELVIVIGIVAILSTVILFSITQYISKGKDANIAGNLSVLVPAGEAYYNIESTYGLPGVGEENFCNSNSVISAKSQMPFPDEDLLCGTGLCCNVATAGNAWVACAQLFTDNTKAYCVDSRGVKKEIDSSSCNSTICGCDLSLCSIP